MTNDESHYWQIHIMYGLYGLGSMSGWDESNTPMWLATQVGKMLLSTLTTHSRQAAVPQEKFPLKTW